MGAHGWTTITELPSGQSGTDTGARGGKTIAWAAQWSVNWQRNGCAWRKDNLAREAHHDDTIQHYGDRMSYEIY